MARSDRGLRPVARQIVRTGALLGLTLAVVPPFVAHMRVTTRSAQEREVLRDRWLGAWARGLLRVFAIEVVVDGVVPPPATLGGPGRVIVANHRSAIDIGVLLSIFGGTMVSRADLAGWPVIGAGARAAGLVFVDRAVAQSGASTIRVVQRRLAEGRTITIFPEGTTYDGDEVRPFKPGAFVAALGARAEVLPVALAYPAASSAAFVDETFPAHLGRIARGAGTRLVVSIGAPFVPERGEGSAAAAARAQADVQALVARARALAGP